MGNIHSCLPVTLYRHKNMTHFSIILLHEISTEIDSNGECVLDYGKLSVLFNRNKSTIKNSVKQLIKKECILIQKINNEELVNSLKNKNMNGLGYGHLTCSWCGVKTTTMHYHHYPLSKKNGGKNTIPICPNCHHEFHYNESSTKIKLNVDIKTIHDIIKIRNKNNE